MAVVPVPMPEAVKEELAHDLYEMRHHAKAVESEMLWRMARVLAPSEGLQNTATFLHACPRVCPVSDVDAQLSYLASWIERVQVLDSVSALEVEVELGERPGTVVISVTRSGQPRLLAQ